jgi:hypothetical protein
LLNRETWPIFKAQLARGTVMGISIRRAIAALLLVAALVVGSMPYGAMAATVTYGTSSSSSSFQSAGNGGGAGGTNKKPAGPAENKTSSMNTTALVPVTRTFFVRFRGLIIPVRRTFLLPVTQTVAQPVP